MIEGEALADERLADERRTARQVAVRLPPPAADELLAALRDAFADLLEHGRVDLGDPLVVGHRVAGEDELGVLAHPVERGSKCRPDLLVALRPLPEPDRV